MSSASFMFKAAALSGASAILLGAFGAHGLQKSISDLKLLDNWKVAAQYQLVNSVAWLFAAYLDNRTASLCFLGGNLLFSGSLYALTLTGIKKLGAITPIGGLLLTAGWVALAFSSHAAVENKRA